MYFELKQNGHNTVIFVVVEQALKLGMEDLQMFLNENSLADTRQLVVGAFV